MKRARSLLVLGLLSAAAACLPGAITHYAVTLTPVANCAIRGGETDCQPPGDGGIEIHGTLSVDADGDRTRVFFRQEVYVGREHDGHLTVNDVRDNVYENSRCITRTRFYLDAMRDDPGFGLRQQIVGVVEESNTAEGDPQQCGRNVPYGELRRYDLLGTEVTQP